MKAHASSLFSSLQSNVAEVGDTMDSLREKGKQVAAEAAIVDLLRAETSSHSHSSKNFLKNTKRKTVKARLKARFSSKEQKSSGDLLNTSSRPTPLTRSYHPSTNSLPLSRASSIIHSAPEIPPPQTEGSPYMPYRAASPGRTSPSRSWTPSRASTDWPRPPASTVSYEPADINGSPRPGTPSSRYGGSPKRPLPPAPLFAAGRPVSRDSNKTSVEASTISIDDDDVFGDPTEEPRPDLPRDSFASQSTYTEEYTTTDEKTEHYGPAPEGAQARRGARQAQMAKKEVRLINGELILECKIPTILNSFLPRKDDTEFTHMRYTAVTCDPDDFVSRGYKLRQNIGSTARETELFICITMYNENEIDFTRTMHGVMRNITHFCSRTKSRTWGKDGWQKIVVCIISDGRQKVHPRTLDALAAMGCYQDGIAKNLVNQREVTAHVYEYTTQVSLDSDLKFKGAEKGIVPCQMIFCLKEKNQKKLNSHRWFFNAFGRALNPNVCILLDVGTKPGSKALYYLWKAFDTDSNVAGAAGEIKAGKGKGWLGLLNPLVASQNFEYKMSNILDKPLESVFGCLSVSPAARRSRRMTQASSTAMPFKSAPDDAAVADVLGTLSVRVGASRTLDSGTPSAVAATCSILVCRPWPISVPPWLISTEPSLYTCTSAPAWLNAVRLNEMPNFTGVIASARLVCSWVALKASISTSRRSTSPLSSTWLQARSMRSGCRTSWPYGVVCPAE